MSDQKSGRGGKRAGAGRRSKRGTPMPKTAITAAPEQLIFYYLLSGHSMAVSTGVQAAVERLASVDGEAKESLDKAKWMVSKAKEILEADGVEPTQKELYSYCFEHLLDLQDQYSDG